MSTSPSNQTRETVSFV